MMSAGCMCEQPGNMCLSKLAEQVASRCHAPLFRLCPITLAVCCSPLLAMTMLANAITSASQPCLVPLLARFLPHTHCLATSLLAHTLYVLAPSLCGFAASLHRMEILKIHSFNLAKHGDIDYEAVIKLAEVRCVSAFPREPWGFGVRPVGYGVIDVR